MNSFYDKLKELIKELRQGMKDSYDMILEGKANGFCTQSVDPHPLSREKPIRRETWTQRNSQRKTGRLAIDRIQTVGQQIELGTILKNS